MASNQDAWPNAYFLDPGGMRSCSATRVVEASKAAGPVLQYWRQVQADHGGFVVSLRAWVGGNTVKPPLCGRLSQTTNLLHRIHPISEGAGESTKGLCPRCRDPYCGPHQAHSKRFSMASEGESWSLMGWSQDWFRDLLADQTFDMSIDTINLAHVGLRGLGAYENLAYGEAEAFRAAHPTPMDLPNFASVGRLGIPRFNRGMDAMNNYPPHEMVSAMTPATETPPSMVSEIRSRAMDVSLPVLARGEPRKVWACGVCCPEDVGSPSSSEAYSVEANACCPGGVGCSSARCCCYFQGGYRKGFSGLAYDGWSGASCKGNAYGGWNGASSRNAACTGVKHR